MTRMAVGSSDDVDGADAAHAALDRAVDQLAGLAPRAAVVFCGAGLDTQAVLGVLASRLPGVPLVGGTTLAEISVQTGAAEGSLVVVLFAGHSLEAAAVAFDLPLPDGGADASGLALAGQQAVEQAAASLPSPPRLCLCFGFHPWGSSDLHSTVLQALGPEVPVFGGGVIGRMAPDMHGEAFFGERRLSPGAAVLLLSGDIQVTHAVTHGFQPVGEPHTITRALRGGALLEVDGKPALDFYLSHFGVSGGTGAMFVHHPLLVETGDGYLLRGAIAEGPVPGSMALAGEVAEGSRMQLCEFDREGLLAATRTAMDQAMAQWRGPPPAGVLVFECLTRWYALGTWAPRSLDRLRESAPAGTAIAGAYMGGEFAPFAQGQRGQLHNCSVVALLIGSAPA